MLTGVDKRSGEKLSDDNMVAQCITFLVAGHETTSGLLSFAISYLIKHPVVARAQEEVDRVLGTDTSVLPTYQQIQGLTYVTQILNETLRLWPTAARSHATRTRTRWSADTCCPRVPRSRH